MKIKTDFLGPISWGKLHILEGRELMLFLLQNYLLVKHLASVILKICICNTKDSVLYDKPFNSDISTAQIFACHSIYNLREIQHRMLSMLKWLWQNFCQKKVYICILSNLLAVHSQYGAISKKRSPLIYFRDKVMVVSLLDITLFPSPWQVLTS